MCLQGCDASVLLEASYGAAKGSAEKNAPPNLTLEGFEVMDEIKEAVDKKCHPDVSCADLLAISAM
jgi:peroxidase